MTTIPNFSSCPHLGLSEDRSSVYMAPTPAHRCYVQTQLFTPDVDHQERFCLCAAHTNCPLYVPAVELSSHAAAPRVGSPRSMPRPKRSYGRITTIGLLTVLILAVLVYGSRSLLNSLVADDALALESTATRPGAFPAGETETPTATLTPTSFMTVEPTEESAPTTSIPTAAIAPTATPTPSSDVEVVTIGPSTSLRWISEDERRNRRNDSFLYAGLLEGQEHLSAVQFDLSAIPRGALIHRATLNLTGLRKQNLNSQSTTLWSVQLIAEAADTPESLVQADYLGALTMDSISLLPNLTATDLELDQINSWELDGVARAWLTKQIIDQRTAIYARISAVTKGSEGLFAWDSGFGSQSSGNPPALVLNLGPAPTQPPPTPTSPHIIATLTPTPATELTAVALYRTATAVAETIGTYTPAPPVYTPTPPSQNLATAEAAANILGLPPVIVPTATPASPEELEAQAVLATAVAETTGTYTPAPIEYVTPIWITPTPTPGNEATAIARIEEIEAYIQSGEPTSTPLPYNAVIIEFVLATATPENRQTAEALNIIAAANIRRFGLPTATPLHWLVITQTPTPLPPPPTATPFIVSARDFTPTPTPLPTEAIPDAVPQQLSNKIVFWSDRSGATETYFMDPANDFAVSKVNSTWVHQLAYDQLGYSPDRRQRAIVKADSNQVLQIQIHTFEYGSVRQLTALRGINYDPDWSPLGSWIYFVSTDPGNDEIHRVNPEGSIVERLTFEPQWDKHPSVSPDGQFVVFYSNRDTARRQIWIMNADGSGQRNLSNSPYNDWDPVWTR